MQLSLTSLQLSQLRSWCCVYDISQCFRASSLLAIVVAAAAIAAAVLVVYSMLSVHSVRVQIQFLSFPPFLFSRQRCPWLEWERERERDGIIHKVRMAGQNSVLLLLLLTIPMCTMVYYTNILCKSCYLWQEQPPIAACMQQLLLSEYTQLFVFYSCLLLLGPWQCSRINAL